MKEQKIKFKAIMAYKSNDEMESRILSESVSRVVLEVYMSPVEFAQLVMEKEGKAFFIHIE